MLESSEVKRATPEIVEDLGKLGDSVFRPDVEPGTGLMKDFELFYEAKNAENLYYVENSDGRPISSAGIRKQVGLLNGCPLHLATLGNVWTLPAYRGRGISSRIINRILQDLHVDRISLLLVSGYGRLYDRIGCTTVGKMLTVNYDGGVKFPDWVSQGIGFDLVPAQEREQKAQEALQLYQNEPYRYLRTIYEMRVLLKNLGFQRDFIDRRLYVISSSNNEILAYVVTSLDTNYEGEAVVRVIEWAGSRRAFLAFLPRLLEYYDAKLLQFHVYPTDIDMVSYLHSFNLNWVEEPLQGMVRPINVGALFSELQPQFLERTGGELRVRQEDVDGWFIDGQYISRRIEGIDALAKWLFDAGAKGGLSIPLMFTDDLDYC